MALSAAERQKRYRERHPEKIKKYKASQSKKNSDKKYRMNNKEAIKESYKKHKETPKFEKTYINNHLKRNYNITYADYQQMLESQGGVCKICSGITTRSTHTRKEYMPLFVDHCHETGKVSGLLCNHCNVGLAMFREKEDNLVNAISYLKEYN